MSPGINRERQGETGDMTTLDRREYGEAAMIVSYPWGLFYKATKVLCSDGIRRNTKRIAVTADTFFSIPASMTVKGKTVSGYVTVVEDDKGERDLQFRAYTYGKNGYLLP